MTSPRLSKWKRKGRKKKKNRIKKGKKDIKQKTNTKKHNHPCSNKNWKNEKSTEWFIRRPTSLANLWSYLYDAIWKVLVSVSTSNWWSSETTWIRAKTKRRKHIYTNTHTHTWMVFSHWNTECLDSSPIFHTKVNVP